MGSIAELLLNCEVDGPAPKYVEEKDTYKVAKSKIFGQSLPVRTNPLIYTSNGEEIFVVGDFHIASGKNYAGIYRETENFFKGFKTFSVD